jgi:hypothetical protein
MKSAYELAMERFSDDAPSASLTDAQKAAIADIDRKFKAKVAERELFLGDLIKKAQASGSYAEIPEFEKQKRSDIIRLKNKCESEKDEVRKA